MEAAEHFPQLVILGSSAGGIDALSSIVDHIPSDLEAPVVIAQHLDPSRPSHLADILGRRATLPVHGVDSATSLENGHAYVLSPAAGMEVQLGALAPVIEQPTRPAPSIDRILSSAAAVYGEGLIAVILSGSGSDGAAGARHVKAAGGTVVIQNPDTAAYPSMPQAISPSIVDIVADAESIGPLLSELVGSGKSRRKPDDDRQLRSFLASIRERGGIDFGSYKRGTIMRRLQRRMLATGADDLRAYRRHVEANPDEFERLTSSFLINVTEFFRDPDLFDHLREVIIPELVREARAAKRELRIWSAGCSTGEEAYSLAILVAEQIAADDADLDVRIFATDVDLDAIAFARRGLYPASVVAAVPEELREHYFTRKGDRYEVNKAIRSMTVFGQHDLGQRAPFPRVDLALCRNVLIYFTPDLQRRALQLFAFALRDGGILVLGKAESTSPLPEYFALANAKLKTYHRVGERILIPSARQRLGATTPRLKLPVARRAGWTDLSAAAPDASRPVTLTERAEQLLLRLPVGVVVVDRRYDVQLINLAARELLGIPGQAVAEDLIHLLREGLAAQVKGAIDAAIQGRPADPISIEIGSLTAEPAEMRYVEIKAQRFAGAERRAQVDWVVVLATDVTASVAGARKLADRSGEERGERDRALDQARSLAGANEELRTVNRDLTTANAELRTANEELLVASEEVQAATEEVETLNEELQATNEELETMNEEFQATVEELNTTNDDLESRSQQLQEIAAAAEAERAAGDLERLRLLAIVDLIDEPVLVVNAQGSAVHANRHFTALFGEDGGGIDVAVRKRAAAKSFEEEVAAPDGRPYKVSGHPLDGKDIGADAPSGVLILRNA